MKFDWTITLGNVLTLVFIGLPLIYTAFRVYWVLGEFRPHRHGESKGALQAEGISYPRTMNGDK